LSVEGSGRLALALCQWVYRLGAVRLFVDRQGGTGILPVLGQIQGTTSPIRALAKRQWHASGFGFDILPTDPEYRDERGGWVMDDEEE